MFEDSGSLGAEVARLLERMKYRGDELVTSTLTLGELIVMPLSQGRLDLVNRYKSALISPSIRLVEFDVPAALMYGQIRLDRTIKPPDAVQLACASVARCDIFITNDRSLTSKQVEGIQFIVPLDRVPL